MTFAVTQDYEGTLDRYDQATDRLNVRRNPPPDLIFPWVAPLDESHVGITDVWQSREALEAWIEFTQPAVHEFAVAQPVVRIYDVHRYRGTELAARVSDFDASERRMSS